MPLAASLYTKINPFRNGFSDEVRGGKKVSVASPYDKLSTPTSAQA
jgi:hypothetical protein